MADTPDLNLANLDPPPAEQPAQPAQFASPAYDLRQAGPASTELHVRPAPPLRPFVASISQPASGQSPSGRPPSTPINTAVPQATQNVKRVAEQTIEIAPHPTTNRFPWAPVENPKVGVYESTATSPPPVVPVKPAEVVAPVVASIPPIAEPKPTPSPAPQAVAPPKPEPIPQPTPVVEPPHVEPQPVPEPTPKPAAAAEPVPPPAVEPAPLPEPAPITNPEPEPVEPSAPEPEPEKHLEPIEPTKPTPKPSKPGKPDKQTPIIYSDYTKEVWHVFRPNKAIRSLFFICLFLVIGGAVAFWWFSGQPNIFNLKILQPILHAT